jgi:hypothetical protein
VMNTITYLARECAQLHREHGWQGTGHAYDLSHFPADVAAIRDTIGHEPTQDERLNMESEIREQLTFTARM